MTQVPEEQLTGERRGFWTGRRSASLLQKDFHMFSGGRNVEQVGQGEFLKPHEGHSAGGLGCAVLNEIRRPFQGFRGNQKLEDGGICGGRGGGGSAGREEVLLEAGGGVLTGHDSNSLGKDKDVYEGTRLYSDPI